MVLQIVGKPQYPLRTGASVGRKVRAHEEKIFHSGRIAVCFHTSVVPLTMSGTE